MAEFFLIQNEFWRKCFVQPWLQKFPFQSDIFLENLCTYEDLYTAADSSSGLEATDSLSPSLVVLAVFSWMDDERREFVSSLQ